MNEAQDTNFKLSTRDIEWLDDLAYLLDETSDNVVRILIFSAYTGRQLNKMDLRDFTEEQFEQAVATYQADRI